MKLSDRNNAVHFLDDEDPVQYIAVSMNDTTEFIETEFGKMRPLFKRKIQYVCNSFLEAYFKGASKLGRMVIEEPMSLSGTMFYSISGVGTITTFYNIDTKGWDSGISRWMVNGCIIGFANKKEYPLPILAFCHRMKDGYSTSYFCNTAMLKNSSAYDHFEFMAGLILFPNFCEVETKIVEPGKKSIYRNEKYVNETSLPVEILDSTWFTTLIRSEGFMVGGESGGFFRWQRYGPNLSQRKIVWVAPFEKHGYTRRAKILINDSLKPDGKGQTKKAP